jgi:hypothetical protein
VRASNGPLQIRRHSSAGGINGEAQRRKPGNREQHAANSSREARIWHEASYARFAERYRTFGVLSSRLSLLRASAFILTVIGLAGAVDGHAAAAVVTTGLGIALFIGAVLGHRWVLAQQWKAGVRRDVNVRHLSRMSQDWLTLPVSPSPFPEDHPYAADLDLGGQGSLLQRIDTTRTVWGERALADWLSWPATNETIALRQQAIEELGAEFELRQELEAAAFDDRKSGKLSGERFLGLLDQPAMIVGWRRIATLACPLVGGLVVAGHSLDIIVNPAWWLLLTPQIAMAAWSWTGITARLRLIDARRPQLEAFARIMSVVERASFRSRLLRQLSEGLRLVDRPPSHHMADLARRVGWADLRYQPLLHIAANLVLLWDWHVLWSLERWTGTVGGRVRRWLEIIGEIEALASLSVLRALDSTCFPEICAPKDGFRATGLGHPLIPENRRVANDVNVDGPGTVVVITGSNMAGKSTLLRSVGLNMALALAGAPVCALSMRVPILRLRSSMRMTDSLQSGASYFYAELVKLKAVVHDLDSSPPVFFLFDELLRGTNAAARRIGATAVILHLLSHRAMGFVATHDDALSDISELPGVRATSVHMTDVVVDGEMVFDYRLRPGRATTSNALRLLERAGIPLPEGRIP